MLESYEGGIVIAEELATSHVPINCTPQSHTTEHVRTCD